MENHWTDFQGLLNRVRNLFEVHSDERTPCDQRTILGTVSYMYVSHVNYGTYDEWIPVNMFSEDMFHLYVLQKMYVLYPLNYSK